MTGSAIVSAVIGLLGLQIVILGMLMKFAVGWGIFKQVVEDMKSDVADVVLRLSKLEKGYEDAVRDKRNRWKV